MSTASSAPEKHLRLACNRCHAQKLRCPRSTESDRSGPDEPCSRCRKAGAPCIVSKRGKVGRPSKRKATSPPLTDGDEASSRDGHQELEKPSSAGASTVHVFDLGPDVTMQHSQLTPPDTGNRPQMCDAETILLNAERTVTVPNDANGVDPAATAWPSEHSWPCETFHTDPNCYPGSESMLFEPFLQDMKLDLDLPTFHFTPEASETFDLTGSTVGSNNKDVDRTLAQMFNNGAKKPLTPPYGSTADLSRTASLLKLSDLSTRIIRLSEQQRSKHTAASCQANLQQIFHNFRYGNVYG
ncbi:hypothetical protein G7Z17_g2688 [Cylindrodendrum hubeiense]|uniref:Zn(2)-C6 fungal-type domain-containing protein n=1 Tax=Cylindrodendrum hubeiense TaxID=595255 RepID=A0A9P5HDT0_9HYPO|nr:hypothetical protein G7Z17_g2688 [Cylindrodendrum hubeiense]